MVDKQAQVGTRMRRLSPESTPGAVVGIAVINNEWMPTAAAIEAQLDDFGIRMTGKRNLARRLADQLAEDEQVVDMIKPTTIKIDAKFPKFTNAGALLFALTDRRLVLVWRTKSILSFTAMPLDEVSDLSALDGGRFEWTFDGHRWAFIRAQVVVRINATQAKTDRFYASLKSRLPT